MTDREQCAAGRASGAEAGRDGRLDAAARPRQWAPLEADGSRGTVGGVKLITAGAPT